MANIVKEETTVTDQNMLFATEEDQEDELRDGVPEVLTEKYLVFHSGGLLFGVDANFVVEIIINHVITPLPIVPDYVSGVINLRGQIIPIVDFRLLLCKPHQENCSIVVLNIDGVQLGILVDSVAQMVDIPEGSILPVPTSGNSAQKYTSGMCTLPDESGTLMVLDSALLLHV